MFKIQWVSDFFELRRLRRDLRIADGVHMNQQAEIDDLKGQIKDLKSTQENLRQEAANHKRTVTNLRKQVREQNGADLLVNALRELGVVPKAPGKHDCFREATRLQSSIDAQNRALANAYPSSAQGQQLANILGGGLV